MTSLELNTIQQLVLSKVAFKDADVSPGEYAFDFTARFHGTMERRKDTEKKPTVAIPHLAAMALLIRRMGIQREAAVAMLIDVMTEAISIKESGAEDMLLSITGVAEAKAALEEALNTLPKTKVKGACKVEAVVEIVTAESLREFSAVG